VDPVLNDDQRRSLISRHIIRSFPQALQVMLLESDPVPTLDKMVSFTRNVRAVERNIAPSTIANVTASPDEISKLTKLV
jgi:hypothetical protein